MDKIKIATTAFSCCFDKEKNLEKCLRYVAQAAAEGCKLIVFPEMVLSGYLHSLVGPLTTESVLYQQENAEVIPEGESVQTLIRAAQEHDIYIVWGMCERDRQVFDAIYNTAVLVGPEGFVGSYRKVHMTMDEKHVFTAGAEYPVYSTSIGKIGLEICYDKCFPEASRELALGGAELLVVLAAWTEYIGDTPEDTSGKLAPRFQMLDSVRAMENQIWLVSSNQYGVCGEGNYCGLSSIVGPDGYLLACTGAQEGMVSAEGAIQAGICRTRAIFLEADIKNTRPDAYRRLTGGARYQDLLTPLQNKDNMPTQAGA